MTIKVGSEEKRVDTTITPVIFFVESERNLTIAKLIDAQGKEHPIKINASGKAQMT